MSIMINKYKSIKESMILLNVNHIYDLSKNLYYLSGLRGDKLKSEVAKVFTNTIYLLNYINKILDLNSVYNDVNDFVQLLEKCLQEDKNIIDQNIINMINNNSS